MLKIKKSTSDTYINNSPLVLSGELNVISQVYLRATSFLPTLDFDSLAPKLSARPDPRYR
jgi:hypothetical protein